MRGCDCDTSLKHTLYYLFFNIPYETNTEKSHFGCGNIGCYSVFLCRIFEIVYR